MVGSILLFPIFNDYVDAAEISGWLYTIGSATFLLADITEWLHYVYQDCRFLNYAINFFVNVIGSLLYLIGSACFIPEIGKFDWGMDLFIVGSSFIMVAQAWKLIKGLRQARYNFKEWYNEDASGVNVDFFAGIGGLMYFSGTFVFKQTGDNPELANTAALIYSFGGLFFFTSGSFIQKRYFWEDAAEKVNTREEKSSSVISTEI